MTQDTNWKVTNSQLYTKNESQDVIPFSAGYHKAQINRRAQMQNKHKTENKKIHKRSTALERSVKYFKSAPTSPFIQMWIKTHRYLACMKDP